MWPYDVVGQGWSNQALAQIAFWLPAPEPDPPRQGDSIEAELSEIQGILRNMMFHRSRVEHLSQTADELLLALTNVLEPLLEENPES